MACLELVIRITFTADTRPKNAHMFRLLVDIETSLSLTVRNLIKQESKQASK